MSGFRHAPRPGFQARRPSRSPQEVRAGWVSAIQLADWLAAQAGLDEIGRHADFGQNLTRLSLSVRDLEPANFPVQAESARSMAAAFLKLARDFCHPGWSPDARTACAAFLSAGAACLDGLLDRLRHDEAAHGRRVLGERDED